MAPARTRHRPKRTHNARQKSGGQLRIIGGHWRGRRLPVIDAAGLRPSADRTRETLFNWLMADIPGARCLDLFAGTGALALEALSRGAHSATLIEKHAPVAAQLAANIDLLGAEGAVLIEGDALDWLQKPASQRYSIVFVDPPFAMDIWSQVLELLDSGDWLAAGALVYIESPGHNDISFPEDWHIHREKRSGEVCYRLLQTPEIS